jgi:hypothetical protein
MSSKCKRQYGSAQGYKTAKVCKFPVYEKQIHNPYGYAEKRLFEAFCRIFPADAHWTALGLGQSSIGRKTEPPRPGRASPLQDHLVSRLGRFAGHADHLHGYSALPRCTAARQGYRPYPVLHSLGRQPFRKKRREPAWARLIAKVYEIDLSGGSPCPAGALARREGVREADSESPLVFPRCGSQVRLIALITDPAEVRTILRRLLKIGRAPPGLDAGALN